MNSAFAVLVGCTVVACACGGGGGGGSEQPPPPIENPCLAAGKAALDGTVCGTDLVCQGGACVACADGASCVPDAAPCHQGRLSCGATPSCADAGETAADGTVCGVDEVCSYGSCVYCVEGQICQTGGPCYYQSRQTCSQGPYCLNQLGNFPDGSTCVDQGKVGTCLAGECIP
jgi:hypothetical protein